MKTTPIIEKFDTFDFTNTIFGTVGAKYDIKSVNDFIDAADYIFNKSVDLQIDYNNYNLKYTIYSDDTGIVALDYERAANEFEKLYISELKNKHDRKLILKKID